MAGICVFTNSVEKIWETQNFMSTFKDKIFIFFKLIKGLVIGPKYLETFKLKKTL